MDLVGIGHVTKVVKHSFYVLSILLNAEMLEARVFVYLYLFGKHTDIFAKSTMYTTKPLLKNNIIYAFRYNCTAESCNHS